MSKHRLTLNQSAPNWFTQPSKHGGCFPIKNSDIITGSELINRFKESTMFVAYLGIIIPDLSFPGGKFIPLSVIVVFTS